MTMNSAEHFPRNSFLYKSELLFKTLFKVHSKLSTNQLDLQDNFGQQSHVKHV